MKCKMPVIPMLPRSILPPSSAMRADHCYYPASASPVDLIHCCSHHDVIKGLI
jgi:hypothetical protein